jgi:DNA-binding GntR family transcriptional regulator
MEPRTLSENIAQQLAAEIIARELPPGTRLDELSLAARFGVSRSPVRDALRHLAATRLVAYAPHRGFSVVAVDAAELEGLFEASSEIEALCARLCAQRATPAERKRIELIHQGAARALPERNVKAYASLNEQLHAAVFAGAHNRTLQEVAANLRQRLAPFRSSPFFTAKNRISESHREHGALVDAVLRGDADTAACAMRDHGAHSAINAMGRIDAAAHEEPRAGDAQADDPPRRSRRRAA